MLGQAQKPSRVMSEAMQVQSPTAEAEGHKPEAEGGIEPQLTCQGRFADLLLAQCLTNFIKTSPFNLS
jgi:hypothetical protein